MEVEVIGRSYVPNTELTTSYRPAFVQVNIDRGMFHFSESAIKNYDILQHTHYLFLRFKDDDIFYITPTDDTQEGFKLTTYKGKSIKGNEPKTFAKLCSTWTARMIRDVYKKPNAKKVRFKMTKTTSEFKKQPLYALTLENDN